MNENEVYHKVIERITVLETKMSERWEAHRQQSDEKWGTMQEELANIFKKLGSLTCQTHKAKIEWLTWSLRLMWMVIIVWGIVRGAVAFVK